MRVASRAASRAAARARSGRAAIATTIPGAPATMRRSIARVDRRGRDAGTRIAATGKKSRARFDLLTVDRRAC